MTYQISNIPVPQNKREDINKKILHVLESETSEKYGITRQNVYDMYTGDGGLHGLSYNDFDSFHAYTKAKQQIENGQFYTPSPVSKFIVDCLRPSQHDLIADLTCGHGSFFNWLPNHSNVYGNELDMKSVKVARFLYPDVTITADDIRSWNIDKKFDLILGNPPFNLNWKVGRDEYLSQLYYCKKSFEYLKPAGVLALIVPCSFLADEFSNGSMIKEMNTMYNFIHQTEIPSDSFQNVGVDSFRTKIMFFQKRSEHITAESKYRHDLPITEVTAENSEIIYNTYIKPVIELKNKLKSKLFFENLHNNSDDSDFQAKITKLLFDIKRNKNVSKHYARCLELVSKLSTQKKPESMSMDEWFDIRLTDEKVIKQLKDILKNQHITECEEYRLIKTAYGLKIKGYSQKDKIYLSKYTGVKEFSFNDMILNNSYPFDDLAYKRLFEKKKREHNRQAQKFQDMKQDSHITDWLDDYRLIDKQNDRVIELNEIQREDVGKVLQKRFSLLQWDCGGGKSIAAIAYAQYRMQHNNIHNMFIVAPAIAIAGTFEPSLTNFKIPFVKVDSLDSINKIQKGDIVLITFNMLTKYQKHIKKFIKLNANKVGLILDESDSIATISSKRTKATLNVFQTVKYKLLTTGTSVRNSIGEAFPQFSLMFNSSINFINYCKEIYVQDKKTNELLSKHNENYMKPFPQYTKGQKLFQESHIPEKITVFGASSNTQHIYNSDVLKNMIDSTIITRTFEEITGRSIATIHQDTCKFNSHEKVLYKKIIDEFYEMARNIYKTGNSRKDAMLQIIQQLNMLIRSCSASHLFKEYTGTGYSSKFAKVFSMIKKWDNEPVVIGCRFKKTVYSYARYIREQFPDRKLFIVTGEDMTLKQRKEMVEEMRKEKNPILVCTQQSLSSSISINYVNKIIVTELSWNGATLHQFTARFVRFDSESNNKEIHYVTYENSIEVNLLKLILSKETLNLFMKDDYINDEELFDRFGVDANIFNMLMTKERTEDGYTRIKWGEQHIV